MWNLLKNNKEIKSLNEQINELQKRIREQEVFIQKLSEDRDYWKSQYEQIIENFDPNDAKLGDKIKKWSAQKMLKNIQDSLQVENLKKRVDNATPEEVTNLFEKIITVKVENIFLHELGEIIIKTTKL